MTTMTASPGARGGGRARGRNRLNRKRDVVGALLALPALALFIAFAIYPGLRVFYLSFFDYNLTSPAEFVGLDNFRYLWSDPTFHEVLGNTLFYVGGTYGLSLGLALLLALALGEKMRGTAVTRLCYFIPVAMSWVAVSVMWRLVLHPHGMLNQTLGLDIPWLTSSTWAPWALVVMSVWKETGFFLILFLAGLAQIPSDLYEAARVDGARAWARFRYVTLPLLKPITAVCVVMAIIRGFQAFSPQVVLTNGSFGTKVINLFVYETAFTNARMGRASAVAVVMFAVLLTLTLVQLRVFRRSDQ